MSRARWWPRASTARSVRTVVGCFFLFTAGVNTGMAFADAQVYGHFAEGAWLDFVRDQWQDVVMAAPAEWALLLATGELLLGALLLRGGYAARVGWVGVVLFHLLLLLFGPGTWWWSVPVLVLLAPVVLVDWRSAAGERDLDGAPLPRVTDP